MTVLRDLVVSGMVGTIVSFIVAGALMAIRGAPASVFAEEAWFLLFLGVTIFGFCYVMLRSSTSPGRTRYPD